MLLPPPSPEQQAIVDSVVRDMCHARVAAVAGAGKTTTILHIVSAMSSLPAGPRQVLVLTYNSKLKSETRVRCAGIALTNAAIHTYHSAALNLYADPTCSRDEGLALLVSNTSRKVVMSSHQRYAVLVVDEAQDMTHLYFSLVRRLLADACVPDVRIIVLGDARQSVYGFKGADARFLTLAPRLPAFAPATCCWREHTLTTSYRLSPRIAHFVNSQLLNGVDLLRSSIEVSTTGCIGSVRYARCNTFGDLPFRQLITWLISGLAPSDIFVLAPSIRANMKQSPVRVLENRLVQAGVRCFAASSDDERLDEDVTRGKVVFATFHQVKGLERRAVMVFNFDDSYHRYFERGSTQIGLKGCPNAIYVAVTRAMSHLTVLHDSKHGPLRTVRSESLDRDCEVVSERSQARSRSQSSQAHSLATKLHRRTTHETDLSVTELLRHQKEQVLQAAMACLTVRHLGVQLDAGSCSTLLKCKTDTGDGSWENVAAITGTALPCVFEYETSCKCTLLQRAAVTMRGLAPVDQERLRTLVEQMPLGKPSISDFLYIANVHIALTSGYTHKLRQIREYDWVTEQDVSAMLNVMRHHVTGPPDLVMYEHPASLTIMVGERQVRLSCAIDCIDSSTRTSFEIKCVGHLSVEHHLQTALNALLLESIAGDGFRGYRHVLLNLCDGSARELVLDRGHVLNAATILLEAKYAAEKGDDDAAFLDSCQQVTASFSQPARSDMGQTHSHSHSHGVQTYPFLEDDEQ